MTRPSLMTLTPLVWKWKKWPADGEWFAFSANSPPVVWSAWLPHDPAWLDDLTPLLSTEERARFARLQLTADKMRFMTGRGLLRVLLGTLWEISPGEIEIKYGEFGKPFAKTPVDRPPVHFNVAHSHELILLAFHGAREVGVDVEAVRWKDDLNAVARQFFSAEEFKRWLALLKVERSVAFFQNWTRREAELKALGAGLTVAEGFQRSDKIVHFDLNLPLDYQGAVACLR